MGDPNSDTIEILWLTSAACKTDTNLATTEERKCYFMQAYEDEGLKARFVDLTNLIRPEGYEITYAERSDGVFKISVCRPLSLGVDHHCNGHLACLTGKDSHFSIDGDVPIPLVAKGSAEGDLHMEGDLLTVVYTETVEECENKKRAVKIHFLCPTGDEVRQTHIHTHTHTYTPITVTHTHIHTHSQSTKEGKKLHNNTIHVIQCSKDCTQ